ncbi:MAG: hypothetical protein ACRC0D_06330, partial [Macrococcoides caseolyticum]
KLLLLCMRDSAYRFITEFTMDTVESKRQKKKFMYEGYLYIFDKMSADHSYKFWRCELKNECKARLHTSAENDMVIKKVNQHSHGSDAAKVDASVILTNIKRKATETTDIPSMLLNNALQGTSEPVQAKLPKKDSVRKMIQRIRTQTQSAPPQPTDRSEIIIPVEYRTMEVEPGRLENFLLWDSGEGNDYRIFIFGRESVGLWSNQIKQLYVDGTFSLAPALFSQIYVVLADRGGFVLPIVYALLPNKESATYLRMFRAIKEIWPNLNPSSISIDFEQAAIGAVRENFPNCSINGCLFHLTKNLKKKLAAEGLLQQYNRDAVFASRARMIVALSFVPINDLNSAFETLAIELSPDLTPVINWFEDFYIGRPNRNGTIRNPLFPPQCWSVYERTLNGECRTNNYAEAAHRRLQAEFGMDHPNIWKFIDGIRTVQKGSDFIYSNFIRGDQPPSKRNKYINTDLRIRRIVESYSARNILEYLKGISHNFLMD